MRKRNLDKIQGHRKVGNWNDGIYVFKGNDKIEKD